MRGNDAVSSMLSARRSAAGAPRDQPAAEAGAAATHAGAHSKDEVGNGMAWTFVRARLCNLRKPTLLDPGFEHSVLRSKYAKAKSAGGAAVRAGRSADTVVGS